MTSPLPAKAGRRCQNTLNPLHSAHYFSPEFAKEMGALGLDGWSPAYFAGRSAAMGAVGAGTVAATYYNFKYELIAAHVPAIWERATPEAVLAARLRAVDAGLRRMLGDAVDSPEMAEAARLALTAAEGCTRHARPLYAAHADLPVPEEPHLALWHAATLLREHRGDGHIAALLDAELGPLEALVSHTATGKGFSVKWAVETRGWSRAEWDAAAAGLQERGLLTAETGSRRELTEAGKELRTKLELATDRLDSAPYEHLGADGVARLTELAGGFLMAALGAGAFPADLIGKD